MRHIFVINQAAGQGGAKALSADIRQAGNAIGVDVEIYETVCPGDGERFVRRCCREEAEQIGADEADDPAGTDEDARLRFYACGGDGTLNEVVNGMDGFSFAEAGCIPVGTGNDFVRNFPEADFTDLPAQLTAKARPCDLIAWEEVSRTSGRDSRTDDEGMASARLCINMVNIGFDGNVADLTARMKRVPLVNGTLAYIISVFTMLIEKKGADLRVEYPDGFVHDGKLLLIAIANGCFCGGGIKGLPRAKTDDGQMDVSLVKDVPRRAFVRLFPKYMNGTHLEEPRLADVIRYTPETGLTITANRGCMKVCIDGEILSMEGLRLAIRPEGVKFVVPAGENR